MHRFTRTFSVAMAAAMLAGCLVTGASAAPARNLALLNLNTGFSTLLPTAESETPIFCSPVTLEEVLGTTDKDPAPVEPEEEPVFTPVTMYATDVLNIRDGAGTDANVVAKVKKAAALTITGEAVDGWYPVSYDGLACYVCADYISDTQPAVTMYATTSLNVREAPGTDAAIVDTISANTALAVYGSAVDGWYKISYGDTFCYVNADYVSEETVSYSMVNYALTFVGCRYRYGATGPSVFDCSGFTRYVYAQYGISLPHSSRAQAGYGTAVSKSELQPGDLVFFYSPISHVGIYIGNGQFVHASNSRTGVIVSSLNSSYYSSHFNCARHITG